MNNVKVEMTIKKNGRWYRFVQCEKYECEKCCFFKSCYTYHYCYVGNFIDGYFERFRPVQELVRIGVRLLKRQALKHFPDSPFICRGPRSRYDSDNEITFYVYGEHRDEMPQEIQALIDRLNALGLSI